MNRLSTKGIVVGRNDQDLGGSNMVHWVLVGHSVGVCGVKKQSRIGFLSLKGCTGPPVFIICCKNNGVSRCLSRHPCFSTAGFFRVRVEENHEYNLSKFGL